jgi:penicillin-binding protein 1A
MAQWPEAALIAAKVLTRKIITMDGKRDFEKSQFNRAAGAMQQPVSVFRPFVSAVALNTAFNPNARRVITPATAYMKKR